MTKVFLIMIYCVQNAAISLEDTCIKEIHPEEYNTVQECVVAVNTLKSKVAHMPDLYTSGFCTTKTIQNT